MVWDRFIRTFHWCLALGLVINYWWLEGGDEFHEWLGYALGALVVTRVYWGIAGPGNARFAHFVVGPKRVLASLQRFGDDYLTHRGHSPLAGWMIVLQFAVILVVVISGWLQELDAFWGVEWPQDLHDWSADFLMITAGMHVLAVLTIQWRYRTPLIHSMLPFRAPPK